MAGNTVYCEVCELPHRKGVRRCEACDHVLGTAPDWEGIRERLPGLRNRVVGGVVVLLGILAGNVVAWGGGGYIIAIGPIAWVVWHAYQYRLVLGRLRLAKDRGDA